MQATLNLCSHKLKVFISLWDHAFPDDRCDFHLNLRYLGTAFIQGQLPTMSFFCSRNLIGEHWRVKKIGMKSQNNT